MLPHPTRGLCGYRALITGNADASIGNVIGANLANYVGFGSGAYLSGG